MQQVSWREAGATPWLVGTRPAEQPVVGGITFGVGLLHQPVERLGVAGLFAAWLTSRLSRPVEAVDAATGGPAQVGFSLDLLHSSLLVRGSAEQVGASLRRAEQLLGEGPDEVGDDLRNRSRTYPHPLGPWSRHLAARWPGHTPYLTALGPLAAETLDAAALDEFVDRQVRQARRAYWTNEPSVPALAGGDGGVAGLDYDLLPPGIGRYEPGCLVRGRDEELFTAAAESGPATVIALTVLARALHRRMVELEALASEVRISRYQVGGETTLACAEATLLTMDAVAAPTAVRQTVADLAEGAVPAGEIDTVRDGYVSEARTAEWHEPLGLLRLVQHHLRHGDFPTPQTVLDRYAQADAATVRERLADLYPRLLLAVPEAVAEDGPPLPLAQPTAPRPPEGRRYHHLLHQGQLLRASQRRVSAVNKYHGQGRFGSVATVTSAGVDFDEVVLRVDTGDQSTSLVDRDLGVVRIDWDLYLAAPRLRRLVDRRTAGVPVVRQPPDPGWRERVGPAVRRARRRRRVGLTAAVSGVTFVAVAAVVGNLTSDDSPPPQTVVESVTASSRVTLPDGSTLAVSAGPELIEHHGAPTPFTYAVQLRLCGGSGRDGEGTLFRSDGFQLEVGGQSQLGPVAFNKRPGPPGDYVDPGECATGWLLYQLDGAPDPTVPVTLHYANRAGDRITWRLPAVPEDSPLSEPCPPEDAACPTPTPTPID